MSLVPRVREELLKAVHGHRTPDQRDGQHADRNCHAPGRTGPRSGQQPGRLLNKLLVGHEIPHRLPEMGIRDLRKNVTLHQPHSGIGGAAPMSRLKASSNNVLTLHT